MYISLLKFNVLKLSAWNPSTPLRERPQTTACLLSGIVHPERYRGKALVALRLNLMAEAHPPTFTWSLQTSCKSGGVCFI